GNRTAWIRQGIGEELAAHLGAAFPADRLHQSGVGDVFDENRVDVFTLDLVDQPGELTGGGFSFSADSHRGKKLNPIRSPELSESVVARNPPALPLGPPLH